MPSAKFQHCEKVLGGLTLPGAEKMALTVRTVDLAAPAEDKDDAAEAAGNVAVTVAGRLDPDDASGAGVAGSAVGASSTAAPQTEDEDDVVGAARTVGAVVAWRLDPEDATGADVAGGAAGATSSAASCAAVATAAAAAATAAADADCFSSVRGTLRYKRWRNVVGKFVQVIIYFVTFKRRSECKLNSKRCRRQYGGGEGEYKVKSKYSP